MFKKIVLFISVALVLFTMNSHYHIHTEHSSDHQHLSTSHDAHSTHSGFHDTGHIDFEINLGIVGGLLLLVVFARITNVFFFIHTKIIPSAIKNRYNYQQIFTGSFFTPLRSILLHAPPR